MLHELKISPEYYDAVVNGIKPFEIRKNDRNYSVGDALRLREFDKDDIYQSLWQHIQSILEENVLQPLPIFLI